MLLVFLIFSLCACMKKGEVKSKGDLPGEELSAYNSGQLTSNSLAFDQSYIDFVYYNINNLAASIYVHSRLDSYSDGFFNAIKSCTTEDCTNGIIADVGLDCNILDEYYFTSIAAGIILRVEKPELDRLSTVNRDQMFRSAFQIGINSADPRWQSVKSRLVELTSYFPSIIQYKVNPNPDWTDYADCVVSSLGVAYGAIMGLNAMMDAIKTGKVGKALDSIKKFVRTGLGRAAGFIGVALIAWDIFKCCWDLAHPDDDNAIRKPRQEDSGKNYFAVVSKKTIRSI